MSNLWIPDAKLEIPELIIPRRKPGGNWCVNRSHRLGGKLGFYVAPYLNGYLREHVRGRSIDANTAAKSHGPFPCVEGNSSSSTTLAYGVGNDFSSELNGLTVFAHFKINNDDTNIDHYLISKFRSGFGPWSLYRTGNESFNREMNFYTRLYNGSGYTTYIATETTKTTADFRPHVAVGRWTGTGGYTQVFIDGVLLNEVSNGTDGPLYGPADYQVSMIGQDRTFGTTGDQKIFSAGVFPMSLSDVEIYSLMKDPYQFLKRC